MASGAGGGGSNSRALLLLLLTSGFFVTGLLFDYMPTIIDDQIKRTVELATNEEIRSIWSRPPVEFDSYYWLYDVQNPDQFLAGEKVRVRKVGPFHFNSRPEKRIIELSANKYRLTYNSTRIFSLNETSAGSLNRKLDQPLVLLNPIYASFLEGTREIMPHLDPEVRGSAIAGVNRMAERFNETLFRITTAREALVGRRVVMVEKAKKMAETFGFALKIPEVLPTQIFGYVALQNSTLSGPFEIYTGFQATMSSLGDVISYKGKRRMTEFKGKCNRLQASAGELRPMPIGAQQNLEMFAPQFCRIIHLKPTGTRVLREGQAVSYIIAPEDFSSAKSNVDNQCFCVNGTRDDYCSLDGAIELAPCSYFSPIVVTMPHIMPDSRITDSIDEFDSELLDSNIETRAPVNKTSQLLILRRLGIPFQADITLTLFMKVIRDPSFRQTGTVPEISYIPLVMTREFAVIPPKLGQIVANLESFLALTYHIKVVMYLSGVVLLCWLTCLYYSRSGSSGLRSDRVVPGDSLAGSERDNGPGGDGSSDGLNGNGHAPSSGAETEGGGQLERDMVKANGGQVTGGGEEGERKRVAALPIDSLSERANSADSNKSQPPSRASRSSVGDGTEDSGGSAGSGKSWQKVREEPATQRDASYSPATANGKLANDDNGPPLASQLMATSVAAGPPPTAQRKSKIFSKLDDELLMRNKRNQVGGGGAASGSFACTERESIAKQTGETNATTPSADLDTNRRSDLQEANGEQEQGEEGTLTRQMKANRRNWFVKGWSNFVRMLSGLRSTISEVGQLDVAENSDDYQDKRLEMLAGKIDSLYNNNTTAASASDTDSNSGGQIASGGVGGEMDVSEPTTANANTTTNVTTMTNELQQSGDRRAPVTNQSSKEGGGGGSELADGTRGQEVADQVTVPRRRENEEQSSGGGGEAGASVGPNGGGLAPSGSGGAEHEQSAPSTTKTTTVPGEPQSADGSAAQDAGQVKTKPEATRAADTSNSATSRAGSLRRQGLKESNGSGLTGTSSGNNIVNNSGSSWLAEPETSIESVIIAPSLIVAPAPPGNSAGKTLESSGSGSGSGNGHQQSDQMGPERVTAKLTVTNQSAGSEMATSESSKPNKDTKSSGDGLNNNKAEIDELSTLMVSGTSKQSAVEAASDELEAIESSVGKTKAMRQQTSVSPVTTTPAAIATTTSTPTDSPATKTKDERRDSGVRLEHQSAATSSEIVATKETAGESSGSESAVVSKLPLVGSGDFGGNDSVRTSEYNGRPVDIKTRGEGSQSSDNNNKSNNNTNYNKSNFSSSSSNSNSDNIGQLNVALNGRRQPQLQQQPVTIWLQQ